MVTIKQLTLEEAERYFGQSYVLIPKLTPHMKESIRKRRERELIDGELTLKEVEKNGCDTRYDIRRISKETTIPGAVHQEDDTSTEGISAEDKRAAEARGADKKHRKKIWLFRIIPELREIWRFLG